MSRLELSRSQILGFRQQAGFLNERLPMGSKSLRLAAWAGLQDSMPRAALLSIHARVDGADPTIWEHSSLLQLWGPRFNAYVVAAMDLPVFSLGRLPENSRGRTRVYDTASRLEAFLNGRRMPFNQAGHEMGLPPNSLRYAAPTGRVILRWDGARRPVIWTSPAPDMDTKDARLELLRRYLYVFGPATASSFARWAGIGLADARSAWKALGSALTSVCTPVGEAWILAENETAHRTSSGNAAPARLLPSGDAYFLVWGADREILLPDARQRAALWTSRVWPGALLVNGEIVGLWRRSAGEITIEAWRRLSSLDRKAVETEALSLPLPDSPITIRWS
jgi:hypothetical protein